MKPPIPIRTALRLLPLLLLAPVIADVAASQTIPATARELTPDACARLARAASDPALAPWQRDVMLQLAHGEGAPADPAAPGARVQRPGGATSADGAWAEPAPRARDAATAVYDPVRDRMVIFGGSGSVLTNDVWILALTGTPAWTKLYPAGTPPSPRWMHSAIYDPLRDRMVVFGGGGTLYLNDVWALSLAGTPTWTQLAPAGTPPSARGRHTAIYDPVRDRMVVFSGINGSVYLTDVWALSLAGTPAWTQLAPAGSPPSARWSHSAIYDPVRDRMLVFAGYDVSGVARNDLWALSLGAAPAWTQLSPTGVPPDPRWGHGAVYDAAGDRMVVCEGWNGTSRFQDVWALSLAGTPAWSALTAYGTLPSGRSYPATIYDPPRGRLVAFGGNDGVVPGGNGDVWAVSLTGEVAWTQLLPSAGSPPGPRYGHTAVHDPVRDRTVLFGGGDNQLWTLSLAYPPAWAELSATGPSPGARSNHSAIYDPRRDRMVVFGGYGGIAFNDVWTLSLGGAPAWTQLAPGGTPPSARSAHSAIYDPVRDRMVVFGGYDGSPRDDVWALSLDGAPAWTALTPTGTPPGARYAHSAIYDPTHDRMVVFGGYGSAYLGDVWALSLDGTPAWTALTPTGTPPGARDAHTATFDPVRERMVVFGGYGAAYPTDVRALTLSDPPAWTELAPGGAAPPGRYSHSAVYDPLRDRLVLFGGYGGGALDDLWVLTWGEPALASVTCPGPVVWAVGQALPLDYEVTNPYGFAETADYTLTSARDWPGFPVAGSVTLGAGGATPVPLSIEVPDSAAVGRNALTFQVALRTVPQSAACTHDVLDQTTPVQLSLMSAEADPHRVRLSWYAAAGGGLVATVYRRTEREAWSALGRATSDGSGHVVWEDQTVTAGTRYGYRLGVPDGGREIPAGEVWVDVPLSASLALVGSRPNPSSDGLMVAFSLPDGAPARLEAFDLSGRRVVAREVGALGGGSHVLRLDEGRALAPGVYLLRLTRAGRSLTARAVVVE